MGPGPTKLVYCDAFVSRRTFAPPHPRPANLANRPSPAMGWQWKEESRAGRTTSWAAWRCNGGNFQTGNQSKGCTAKWWQTNWSKTETSGKPRTSSEPPKPKPLQRTKRAEQPEPCDYLRSNVGQLIQTLSKLQDPGLEGIRRMLLEAQNQLRTTESKEDKHARLTGVMGQIKHRKEQGDAAKSKAERLMPVGRWGPIGVGRPWR